MNDFEKHFLGFLAEAFPFARLTGDPSYHEVNFSGREAVVKRNPGASLKAADFFPQGFVGPLDFHEELGG
jgi:hypothetical protein